MADTAQTIMTRMATKLANNPDTAKALAARVNGVLRAIVTGAGGGDWFVDALDPTAIPTVRPYNAGTDAARV